MARVMRANSFFKNLGVHLKPVLVDPIPGDPDIAHANEGLFDRFGML